MRKIYKYKLDIGTTKIELPMDSMVMTVQVQDGKPFIWVLVDVENNVVFEEKTFIILGTGQSVPEGMILSYINTFQLYDGNFIGHVFEII